MTSVIYIGPNIEGFTQNAVFTDGIPNSLVPLLAKYPEIGVLIVPLASAAAAKAMASTPGTPEYEAYSKLSGVAPESSPSAPPVEPAPDFYAVPVQSRQKRTDGTIVNPADGVNMDGSQNVKIVGNDIKLIDALSAPGTGQAYDTLSFKQYSFEVGGTATSFMLQIEIIGKFNTPLPINKVWNELSNGYLTGKDISEKGFYSVAVPAFAKIQANLTAISGGNISVTGGLMP